VQTDATETVTTPDGNNCAAWIMHTCTEKGLPASADDVALIENARQLRAVEASMSSMSSMKERAKTIKDIERCRFFYREQEIEEYDSDNKNNL